MAPAPRTPSLLPVPKGPLGRLTGGLLALAVVLCMAPARADPLADGAVWQPEAFTFYSAIHSNPEVDPGRYGLREIALAYAAQLWPKGADRAEPDREYIVSNLRGLYGDDPPERLVINVEHWSVGMKVSDETRAESVQKYIQVARAVREALPGTRIGFYAVLPVREYWIPVEGDADEFAAWRSANRQLEPLARQVDFIAPSLYTFYDDADGWARYAEANIAAARRYGKPVYPFLWPLYHDSNRWLGETPIEREFFDMQLGLVRGLADGAIIWNGPRENWKLPEHWFEQTGQTIQALEPP